MAFRKGKLCRETSIAINARKDMTGIIFHISQIVIKLIDGLMVDSTGVKARKLIR